MASFRVGQAPPYITQLQAVRQGFVGTPFTIHPPLTAAALALTDEVRGHFVGHFVAYFQGATPLSSRRLRMRHAVCHVGSCLAVQHSTGGQATSGTGSKAKRAALYGP